MIRHGAAALLGDARQITDRVTARIIRERVRGKGIRPELLSDRRRPAPQFIEPVTRARPVLIRLELEFALSIVDEARRLPEAVRYACQPPAQVIPIVPRADRGGSIPPDEARTAAIVVVIIGELLDD